MTTTEIKQGSIWRSNLYPEAEATIRGVTEGWLTYEITKVPERIADELGIFAGATPEDWLEFWTEIKPTLTINPETKQAQCGTLQDKTGTT